MKPTLTSNISYLKLLTGASSINVSTGYAHHMAYGKIRYVYMNITFTLSSPNADMFQLYFSNINLYSNSMPHFGIVYRISKDESNYFKYILIANKNGYYVVKDHAYLNGNFFGTSQNILDTSIWYFAS